MIREKIKEGLEESFPLKSRNRVLEVSDIKFDEKDYSSNLQKKAILRGDTLFESVKGTVKLKDQKGATVGEEKDFTLARVPWFTPRHTMIVGGNEYSVSNMVRPKPGVYARKRANGILEASFNVVGGSNFNVSMDPEKGQPQLEYGTTKIPLYPILRKSGMDHDRIAKSWGKQLADTNFKKLWKNSDKTVDKLYSKLVPEYRRTAGADSDTKITEIFKKYDDAKMDPEVTQQTLGKAYDKVSPDSLLDASNKVLRIFKNTDEVDDRDNLDFKTFHSVDDFFKERIKLDARDIGRKAIIKSEATPDVKRIMPSGPFTSGLIKFLNSSQLSSVPTQTNPMELIDASMRVTSLGEGGISSERAIPMEARQVHVTQLGALDPIRTPESFRAGIDVRAAMAAKRDARGNIYVPLIDAKSRKGTYVRAGQLQKSIIAFPNQKLSGTVDALEDGQLRKVSASKVKYQMPHVSSLYSPTTNLIPFLESAQGNRAVMGSKMQVQSLSLVDREEPFIQVKSDTGTTFEHIMGGVINPNAPVDGVVTKVDDDYIYIRPDKVKTGAVGGTVIKVPYEHNFPLAAKTYLNHDLKVKKGDRVTTGQQLGESNFTRNGKLALGRNLRVAYMAYDGANSNDAVVVSEKGAKKLTSERMYKVVLPRDPDLTFNKEKHKTYYGHDYTKDQYNALDKDGVMRPGTKINPGDPLVAGLRKSQLSADDLLLGKLHKSLAVPFRERTETWDHEHPGEVIDVVKTPKRIALTVKTREPATIGDKLCYTKDTEVLTSEGWVPVADVRYDTICYTLNQKGDIELHAPTALHQYAEAGELYELESQQVNLRVTPNHNLYVKKRGSKKFTLTPANEVIGKRVRHKKDGKWHWATPITFSIPGIERKGSGRKPKLLPVVNTLAWCRFLGAYLANGSYTIHARKDKNYSIEYRTQVHTIEGQHHSISKDQHSWIKTLIADCGFTGQQRKDRHIISSRQLTEYLSQFGHAQHKHIPREVFSWGADAAEAMLEGLLGCDGHATATGSLVYTTVSKQLADDVQRLALHAGYAANIKVNIQENPNWSTCYRVSIVRKKCKPQVNHGHTRTQNGQSERIVPSKEPVWGITVPNHILYVRVKGTPVWSGNSGRYGNKGVISQIVPDDQMIKDEKGNTLDLLLTPAGVVSRINPSQIIETAVGKVVEKTGKPIKVENFSGNNNVRWAKDLLKKHGLKDKETVYDPRTGKKIPGVMVGRQYTLKLFKSTDTNFSARGVENYDVNLQPAKGGSQSAKVLGRMEMDALLAHNARNVLQEAATLKSQKNDEWWRNMQLGYPTPPPKTTFAADKFLNMLTGAGVRSERKGSFISLGPLTDADTLKLSAGEIKDAKIIRAKDLKPERGGLFDPAMTGGLRGTKWSHIDLAEPIVSPVFKEPVRRFLGMTNTQLNTAIKEKGGKHIKSELKKIDLDAREKTLRAGIKRKSGSTLDGDVKQLKYIRALKSQNLTPDKAYIVSKVPVIPPVFRPVIPGKGGQEIMYGDANPLYRDLVYLNNQFKDVKKIKILPEEEAKLRPALQEAVGAVYGVNEPATLKSQARGHKGFLTNIAGKGSPKYGYFHSKLMRRTQDISGRGTIVPDTTLGLDEVGLPEDMLWSMYDKFAVKRLVHNGYQPLEAQDLIKKKHPAAREAILREAKERPVMVNRAPTLHRYNMLGAYPKPVPGKTIRINPFMEKGLSADYDGDSADSHLAFVIDGKYSRLHISDCPHIKENAAMKGNKEKYEVPAGVKVFGFSEDQQKVVLCDVTHFSVHHDLEMVEVETRTGRKVKVSRDHSMFGLNPATGELERFKAEDGIGWGTPRPRKLFSAEQLHEVALKDSTVCDTAELNSDTGWYIGAWAGDGWVTGTKDRKYINVGLATVEPEIKKKFDRITSDFLPGVSITEYVNEHEFNGVKCVSKKTHVNSGKFARFLGELTEDCRGAKNKKLPSYFVRAPREFLLGLLGGLLDTDGSASIVKAQAKNKPQYMVQYTTMSEALADHVGILCTMLGIRSNTSWYQKKKKGNWYCQVSFSTPDVAKIAAEIPCAHKAKRLVLAKLSKVVFDPNEATSARWDMVPIPISTAEALRKTHGNASKKLKNMTEEIATARKAVGNRYRKLANAAKDGRISREALYDVIRTLGEEVVQAYSIGNWFELVTNEDIHWDFIETVVPIEGRHTAWDLTVPDGNTFMTANQLIVFDTMMVHAPVQPKAVEDVKKMTLSNLLFGDKSRDELMVFPQHEAIMGIAHASEQDNKNKTVVFKTRKDAMQAYNDGKIDLGTRMKIGK